MRGQFLEHPGHRRGDRQPLPDLPRPVDPHADEEGDRPGRCVGGHPAGECGPAHRGSPVVTPRTEREVSPDVDTGNMYTTTRVVDTVNMVELPAAARRYHHGNLRAALIDTAVDQARAGGADAVVLRDAARRARVSHNAAYRHFADRDDLLAEVSARGMAELEGRMRERLADIPDDGVRTQASARLREAGRQYVHFALAEPGLFATAFAC